MKNRIWIVAGLIAATAMAQDGVTIRRKLAEGETTYAISIDNLTNVESPMGAQDIKTKGSSTLVFKVDKVAGESAEVTLTNKDIKMEMDAGARAPPDAPKPPSEVVTKGKFDQRNRLTDLKIQGTQEGGMGAMMARMSQTAANWSTIFFEFPEAPVKSGGTWDVKIPANPEFGVGEAVFKVTFDGETDGILRFSFTGKTPVNVDSAKMPGGDSAGFTFVITGTNETTGTAAYVKETGELLNYASTAKGTASMDVMGQSIPMKTNTSTKIAKK